MVRPAATVGWWFLGFLLLLLPHPGTPWYKHSASPRYHTVGRASGLLIGVRRSPYLWRRQMTEDKVEENQQREVEGMKVTQGAERSNFLSDPRETPERWEKQLEQERSLEEVRRDLQEKEEELQWSRRSLQGSGEQKRRLPSPAEDLGLYKEERSTFPGGEDRPPALDNFSVPEEQGTGDQERELQMQGESNQPWTRQSRADLHTLDTESVPSGSWNEDHISCDDFKLIFYKFLCQSSLRFLSQTPLRARRQRSTTDELEGLH
ncbi:hypothetical protein XENTR_v10023865 [Xenopus tropicalis]|uniref:Neuropeptide W n=1 Tax=Xenopus tropicalis TaxID=8364 RepID=A0A8J0R7D8_XENTR|nr:neuropeptide W [Xenopus tropicalis]KAE8578980.1 hypothetical protein XENTR_v10023865 [Xenopus tropicalis]|eukprot:XP_004918111.1 PREDICTED: neuropeptide W [Xenopus tropicalis]